MDNAMDVLRADGKENFVKILANVIATYQNIAAAGIAAGLEEPGATPANGASTAKEPGTALSLSVQPAALQHWWHKGPAAKGKLQSLRRTTRS